MRDESVSQAEGERKGIPDRGSRVTTATEPWRTCSTVPQEKAERRPDGGRAWLQREGGAGGSEVKGLFSLPKEDLSEPLSQKRRKEQQ